ncbi:MAG: sugar ABC transporter permease [Planctomycetes bacterium]|nr:sugar ABC transporter permease [Planctomycetota bacterium]
MTVVKKIKPYIFLIPALVFVILFLIYPAVHTIIVSFMEWNGISKPQWIGFDNYVHMLQDPAFWIAFRNTILWVIGSILIPVTLGLIAALLIYMLPGQKTIKLLLFLPYALSGVVISIMWSYMYRLDGAINGILKIIGFVENIKPWLQVVPANTFAMIITNGWRMTGTNMVLFSIGMQAIPDEPIEAAYIEGSSNWQIMTRVIIPMMASTTAVVVIMAIINGFNVFDIVWVMTEGGPYRSSATLAVNMYRESFVIFKFGRGAANAVTLSLLVFVAAIFYMRVIFKKSRIGE